MQKVIATAIWLQVLVTAVATLLVIFLLDRFLYDVSPAVYFSVTAVNITGIVLQRAVHNSKKRAWTMVASIVISGIVAALMEKFWL